MESKARTSTSPSSSVLAVQLFVLLVVTVQGLVQPRAPQLGGGRRHRGGVPHPHHHATAINSGANGAAVTNDESSLLNGEAKSDSSSFVVGILGDLHIDPRKMEDYDLGRQQWLNVFEKAKETVGDERVALVSLGDLGESKNCGHNDLNPSELFAGTTLCHEMAAEYLSSFGVPYEVIGGNHDLEGIDEFKTDAANLRVFLKKHNKPTPQFCREIADKTLLVGLCSTIFRDAKYTSHEVIVDQAQIAWFEELCRTHPAEEGWKLFVFSHAPPNGSGLRVLQENHVINGWYVRFAKFSVLKLFFFILHEILIVHSSLSPQNNSFHFQLLAEP